MWLPQTCPYNTATKKKGNIKALNVTYKYNAVDKLIYIYKYIYKFKN